MPPSEIMAHNGTASLQGTALYAALAVLAVACGTPSSDAACVWGVDELLSEVDVNSFQRMNCGAFNSLQSEETASALQCLLVTPAGRGAEFSVNYCIDCEVLSTYVLTPDGGLFHVRMEHDSLGDDVREASVEHCAALKHDGSTIECVDASLLYSCQERFR